MVTLNDVTLGTGLRQVINTGRTLGAIYILVCCLQNEDHNKNLKALKNVTVWYFEIKQYFLYIYLDLFLLKMCSLLVNFEFHPLIFVFYFSFLCLQ